MANLSIEKIGSKIFTPKANKTIAKSTNPFAKSTFKGNVLTADVFEVKATKQNKLTYSTFVGSMWDALPTFKKAMESVVAFGQKVKERTTNMAHKIREWSNTEISMNFAEIGKNIKSGFNSMIDNYSVQRLKKYNVMTLENMWKELSGVNIAV